MHSKMKGNTAEFGIIHALSKVGCHIFKELGDLSKIDIIAEFRGKLIRIQCKGVTPSKGCIPLQLKKSGPNYEFHYEKEQFDFFAIYNMITGEVALLSSDILTTHKHQIYLRVDQPLNDQKQDINWFKDFTNLEKILEDHINKDLRIAAPECDS